LFGSDEVTPVQRLGKNLSLLKLSQGPTLAFKDVPLQLVLNMMERELERRGTRVLNVLGSTSGDTGAAAEFAAIGKILIRIFMLIPDGRTSLFQRLMMTTLRYPNIFNLIHNGTFDDGQATVVEVNADTEFKEKYNIGAINSLNWARIATQVVYYVYAYLRTTKTVGEPMAVVVPSGNFGNAFAAYVARQMGLPITIIVATNENDVLHQFFSTGLYRVRKRDEVQMTPSPSMDICAAANFERLVFDMSGRNPGLVRTLWRQLGNTGQFQFNNDGLRSVWDLTRIESGRADQAEVFETIQRVHRDYQIVIDPHTAVGMTVAMDKLHLFSNVVVAETALPAKFAETMHEALGFVPPASDRYQDLLQRPERFFAIEPDVGAVKLFITEHVSA
jgi:threonine synthase